MPRPATETQTCPKCGETIIDPDDVVILKSPARIIGKEDTLELIQHTPEKDKPARERRRHCGEWLLR